MKNSRLSYVAGRPLDEVTTSPAKYKHEHFVALKNKETPGTNLTRLKERSLTADCIDSFQCNCLLLAQKRIYIYVI